VPCIDGDEMMINDAGKKGPDPKEEWLQDLVEKVVHQLNVKKEMDILFSEIPKETNEIEFLRDRTEAARKRLDETENAIKKIQPGMAEPKRELARLQGERHLAAEEYEKLRERQNQRDSQISILPKIKAEILETVEEVRNSSHRIASLQSSHTEALQRKQKLGEECKAFKEKLINLEEEIPIMRNTRDILGGTRPENFDVETFEATRGDVETTFENYVNDMTGEIERLKNKISSSKEQLDAIPGEEEALLSKRGLLQETLEELRTHIGEDQDRESLMAEAAELEKKKQGLGVEAEQIKQETAVKEAAIQSLDGRFEEEREIERNAGDRHSYLLSRKQEMGNFENVTDEIQRLKDEIQRLNQESEINKTMYETIEKLNQDVEPTKRRLHSTLQEYDRIFDEFEREING